MGRNMMAVLLLAMTILSGAGCTSVPRRTAPAGANGMDMVSLKGGCFTMGDMYGVGRNDEKPLHEVCLNDFSIGKYEVTQAQWTEVMGSNPSSFKNCGPECPVENISWSDTQAFIKKLNELTKKNYRLPTEAEWEYAARDGGKNKMWSGTSDGTAIGDFAWFEGNSEARTHAVGERKPNDLGIYDMTGNVWEWCGDLYSESYYKNSPGKNPGGVDRGVERVTRGGSFASSDWNLRSSARGTVNPKRKNNGLGFRLVLPDSR